MSAHTYYYYFFIGTLSSTVLKSYLLCFYVSFFTDSDSFNLVSGDRVKMLTLMVNSVLLKCNRCAI